MDDFDAGIVSSAAWTTSLEGLEVRSARALYAFDGQEEYRELRGIVAGDDLQVIKEDLPDGWSLVRATATARPSDDEEPPPRISAQTTGEWLGPLHSLLGGHTLNRFSSFVTSGAEAWVLNGVPDPDPIAPTNPISEDSDDEVNIDLSESDRHYIDTGPSWKSKIPPFKILVHSPSKRTSVLSGPYTVYNITSLFSPDDPYDPPLTSHHNRLHSDFIPRSMRRFSSSFNPQPTEDDGDGEAEPEPLQRITVQRRFSHFLTLHNTLLRRLPGLALPPLPAKQYTGRFNSSFIEARRSDLERYLNTLIRHPIIRYAEILIFFLSCPDSSDSSSANSFTSLLPKYTNLPPAGPGFYAKVYHPAYNLDFDDAKDVGEGFEKHVKTVKKSVQGLRSLFGRVREARVEMARMERGLGYAILGMITPPRPIGMNNGSNNENDEDEEERGGKKKDPNKGIVNSQGAWCWRENCRECPHLTKGLQKLSDTLQSVADLYDDHARRTQLATHESLKSMAHPDTLYAPILSTHNATLSRYHSALDNPSNDPAKSDLASRCETVLNTTMSEMDIYHTQKIEDFYRLGVDHLDGEIKLYEQILTRLRTARSALTSPSSSSSHPAPPLTTEQEIITPSIYTRDLFPPPPSPSSSSSSPSSPPGIKSSKIYPYKSSTLITTSHKFIPSNTNATGGEALGIGEVQIPSLPMPAPHVFDGLGGGIGGTGSVFRI
ncbi:Sorting nexin-33 [Leucoagaricus sp. SymC.cos]|nr:Sorting nexin-33 [Leucoagaricus sp. SymC.cos]